MGTFILLLFSILFDQKIMTVSKILYLWHRKRWLDYSLRVLACFKGFLLLATHITEGRV